MLRFLQGIASILTLFSLQFASQASEAAIYPGIQWHFKTAESLRLFQYLAEFYPTQVEYKDPEVLTIGGVSSFGCSNLPECYLNLSQSEWKLSKTQKGDIYNFLLRFGGHSFDGRITIAGSKVDFAFTELASHRSFHFKQAIECPSQDCSLTMNSTMYDIGTTRPTSAIVIDNTDFFTVRLGSSFGGVGQSIYSDAGLTQQKLEYDDVFRLGREFYCFGGGNEKFCQAILRKFAKNWYMTEPLPGSKFRLVLQVEIENSFFSRYHFWYVGNQHGYQDLGTCPDCFFMLLNPDYPGLAWVYPPQYPIGGGGTVVGWGRQEKATVE